MRTVSVTASPAKKAPTNSKIAAMITACLSVRAREPTEVPIALATSLAPMFHARYAQTNTETNRTSPMRGSIDSRARLVVLDSCSEQTCYSFWLRQIDEQADSGEHHHPRPSGLDYPCRPTQEVEHRLSPHSD